MAWALYTGVVLNPVLSAECMIRSSVCSCDKEAGGDVCQMSVCKYARATALYTGVVLNPVLSAECMIRTPCAAVTKRQGFAM